MEGDIVFAHELDIFGFVSALVCFPERFPVPAGCLGPFLCRRDIADRGIEPDIENLLSEARTRVSFQVGYRDSPAQITCDRTGDKSLIEPFIGDRDGKGGPVAPLFVYPCADRVLHLLLEKIQMLGLPQFDIAATCDRGEWVDEFDRVEQAPAAVALISARLFITAMRAGPFDIAIR